MSEPTLDAADAGVYTTPQDTAGSINPLYQDIANSDVVLGQADVPFPLEDRHRNS